MPCCKCDIWEPSREIPVGHGQTRRGYVVVCCLPYSRAGAGTLVFQKEAPDLHYGIARCLFLLGGLAETLVWDREGALHAGGSRPTDPFAAFLGELRLGWRFLEPKDPESKGVVERLQGYLETSFEPGRRFDGSRPNKGGQASDQASERAPGRYRLPPSGHIPAKTLANEVSQISSHR